MPVPSRIQVIERDLSGFATTVVSETGAIVLNSVRGRSDKPVFCQGEQDVLTYFGRPNSKKWGVFEAVNFCRVSPAWIVSAIGRGAKYAGCDVLQEAVVPFGKRTGRLSPYTARFRG